MGQQHLDFGTAAPNDGEFLKPAFEKIEANFSALFVDPSVDNGIVRFDGEEGNLQGSLATISDVGLGTFHGFISTPVANTSAKGIHVTQSITTLDIGTAESSDSFGFSYNFFDITDGLGGDVGTAGTHNVYGLGVNLKTQANAEASRVAVFGQSTVEAATTGATAGTFFSGLGGVTWAKASLGGTNTGAGAKGSLFSGFFAVIQDAAATNYFAHFGVEISTANSGTVAHRIGLALTDLGPADTVAGATTNAHISLGSLTGATRKTDGILLSDLHGQYGLSATGTFIRAATGSLAKGVDLTAVTFSGNAFSSPNFAVASNGLVTSNSLRWAFNGNGILGSDGNELLVCSQTGSAVNHFQIANAATGNSPVLSAVGDDTNIGLTFTAKGAPGTGVVYNIGSGNYAGVDFINTSVSDGGPEFRIYHNSASPATSDYCASVVFQGNNASGTRFSYAALYAQIRDTTAGSEDARLEFYTSVAGSGLSGTAAMRIQDGVVIGTGAFNGYGTLRVQGSVTAASLLLPAAGVIDFASAGIQITEVSDLLVFSGALAYAFNAALLPSSSDGAALGGTSNQWSDVFLASGAVINFNNGNLTATHAAGQLTFSGSLFAESGRVLSEQFSKLTADRTGSDVNTAQAVFGTTEDAITLSASTTYEFEALYWITRAAGTTSHTTATLFGGTATFTSIDYLAQVTNPTGMALAATQQIAGSAATALVLTAANTSATENVLVWLKGTMRINGAGTVIPQFQFSAAPGGAPTIKRNSYFRIWPQGSNTIASQGNWA